MKSFFIILVSLALYVPASGQPAAAVKIDTTRESVQHWNKWASNLYDMGVEKRKDSFFVKEEVIRLMKDESYRKLVYPDVYEWQVAVRLMQEMELKKAFWYMINLYQTDTVNRHLIAGTVALYDSLLEMDKIIVSTFYTYAFADPRVCRITDGKPDIYRPDLLERGLYAVKEITKYIWAYRKQKMTVRQ